MSDPNRSAGVPRRGAPPVGTIVTLAVAAILYAGMMANLGDVQNADTDAAGRGLGSGFGLVFMVAEWIALAIVLMIGGVNGAMPAWAAIVAAILWPLSGFAAIAAIRLLEAGGSAAYQLVPALIAPVTAGYALWARLPALHRAMRPLPVSLAAWGAVALLTAAPWLARAG